MASAATQAFASKPSLARPIPGPVARAALASVSAHTPRQSYAAASAVVLKDLLLKPSGILFGMHPTEARIMIIAAAASALKVCQFGSTGEDRTSAPPSACEMAIAAALRSAHAFAPSQDRRCSPLASH
jgi:hypothetical protein